MTDELMHYGTKMHSGRYPWGSGENPYQRLDKGALDTVAKLRDKGLTDKEIADGMGIDEERLKYYSTVNGIIKLNKGERTYKKLNGSFNDVVLQMKKEGMTEREIAEILEVKDKKYGQEVPSVEKLRAYRTIARENQRIADRNEVLKLKKQGYGNSEIGRMIGKNESSVRALIDDDIAENTNKTRAAANQLKKYVDEKTMVDIGAGAELDMGITATKLKTAVEMLRQEGYEKYNLKVPQLGTDHVTNMTVLCKPGTTFDDMIKNRDKIKPINETVKDVDGSTLLGMAPFEEIKKSSIDPKRIQVVYAEDGGTAMDGVIELRRGVDDISLGKASYAQVRIPVNGTHYLKGMAIYADDLPKGVDIRFNSNKKRGTPLMSEDPDAPQVLKSMKVDKDNPFGATIKKEDELRLAQRYYTDPKTGEKKLSAINIVNEEGTWDTWSRALSAQFLSKQPTTLAKQQLNLAVVNKKDEFEEIKNLTNPTIKRELLLKFADGCDSAAVDLKAAAFPRQANKVILPVKTMKSTEIYAPGYENGGTVALVRFPHGGQFEIPILTVNNKHKQANAMMKNATDAVGINSEVAERLSGADFDGDSVLVIPMTRNGKQTIPIKSKAPLEDLKNFNNKDYYKPGLKMADRTKQIQMGVTTNLIADMQLKGAPPEHVARAIKHSMVVIDAQKHSLDWKQSAKDNNIRELKKLYQNGGGASTLITRSGSEIRVPKRKEMYKPDPKTGEKRYVETPETYVNKEGKTIQRTVKTTRMAEVKDARELMSSKEGLPVERLYADYANTMKSMGNEARKLAFETKETRLNPSAAKVYAKEVSSLKVKLNNALKNAPKERQAQLIANQVVSAKKRDNPNMSEDDLKKIKGQALAGARARVGAHKERVTFTDKEWEAVQAGAIGSSNLRKLLQNADLDEVKKLATPRKTQATLSSSQINRIKAMGRSTYSLDEIAKALGVSTSTVSKYLKS